MNLTDSEVTVLIATDFLKRADDGVLELTEKGDKWTREYFSQFMADPL